MTRLIDRIEALLREGLGVEDIAVRLSCEVEAVRLAVRIFREEGRLVEIVTHCASQEKDAALKDKRPGQVLEAPAGPNRSAT